jgi:predicted PurR-regulated permease PerM
MPRPTHKPEWQRAIIALSAVGIALALVSVLYLARSIFVPLALAVFFTFVLSPPVRFLERRRVPRPAAVILAVGVATVALAATVYVIGVQVGGLADTLVENEGRIRGKIQMIRGWVSGGGQSRLGKFFEGIETAITVAPPAADGGKGPPGPLGGDGPLPEKVIYRTTDPSGGWTKQVQAYVEPVVEMLGQGAFAFILVVFMLIKREDLRNRFLRLLGQKRVTTATKAVDDASRRVSRYLLTQLLLNAGFGAVVTVALFLLGVPLAPLWGFVGFLMRYVPYVGTWIGVIPPVLFSFALSDWAWQPVAVLGVIVVLELICNNVFEPWLYGTSLGLSEVAQLVAAGFWSFLWGPIGLILSGPVTTCLLVLGKYAPQLRFLEVLLGDEPPLEPSVMYFQRLAARDADEAARVLVTAGKDGDAAAVYDRVVVPALALTRTTAEEGELDAGDEQFIFDTTRELIEDVAGEPAGTSGHPVRLLVCPARDEADQLAGEMLALLLGSGKWETEVTAAETLTAELVEKAAAFGPAAVCIAALPPGGLAHTRYLCKRLRNRFPDLRIVLGRWGGTAADAEAEKEELAALGVDAITTTLAAARDQLKAWQTVLEVKQADEPAAGAVGTATATA